MEMRVCIRCESEESVCVMLENTPKVYVWRVDETGKE